MKIITGNPGTGKHTLAKVVSKKLGLEIVDINKVAISEGIFEKNLNTFDVDVKELKKIIDRMAQRNSLLVGHLAPYVASNRNVEIAIVLRKSPYNLQAIYKKRNYSKKTSLENLGSEILGIIYYDTIHEFGRKKTFQIDTTNCSISEVSKKIEDTLGGLSKKEDKPDWLQLIQENGDIKRFFPY